MPYFHDRVKETSTTTGTGDFTLAGTSSGFRTFNGVVTTLTSVYYVIEHQTNGTWETGVGTFTSPSTLARTTITSNSSNTTSAISFAAGNKNVFIDANTASMPIAHGSTYYMPPIAPGGRLSLTSAVPVTTSDVSASSIVYYVPYTHNVCPVYDGTRWEQVAFSTPSITLSPVSQTTRSCTVTNGSPTLTLTSGNTTGLYVGQMMTGTGVTATGQIIKSIDSSTTLTMAVNGSSTVGATVTFYACNCDIFGTSVGGALSLVQLAWTDNTTRATALTTQDGRLVKSGDATQLYLGSVRMTNTTYASDTVTKRFLFNNYNRVQRTLSVTDATNTANSSGTSAYRYWFGNSNNKVEFFTGLSEEPLDITFKARSYAAAAANNLVLYGIGLDTITAPQVAAYTNMSNATYDLQADCRLITIPSVGYHYAAALDLSVVATTTQVGGGGGIGGLGLNGLLMG